MTKSIVIKNQKNFIKTLRENNIKENIIEVFDSIDQAIFFDEIFENKFYTDEQISIGFGEKSDNFFVLAKMIDYLDPKPSQRILEVGTGSGYATSILSMLCKEVITVEKNEQLAIAAKKRLYAYEFDNIRFLAGDATDAENSYGPINGVIVHAACKKRPLTLISDLTKGGKMIYPMGPEQLQQVICLENTPDKENDARFKTRYLINSQFSKIKGSYGYDTPDYSELGEEYDWKPTLAPSEKNDIKKEIENKKESKSEKIKRKFFGLKKK